MTSPHRLSVPFLALLGLVIFGISTEALSQGKRTEFAVVVLPEPEGDSLKCGTYPDTLRINRRQAGPRTVVGFLAAQTDVTVSGLNGPPAGNPNGPPLSDSSSVNIKLGHLKRILLKQGAVGTYGYTVVCDTIPDAPPAIIIDP